MILRYIKIPTIIGIISDNYKLTIIVYNIFKYFTVRLLFYYLPDI